MTYVLAGALAAALLALAPRVGSHAITLGGGLASGGAVATVVTGFGWSGGVPNPLVAGGLAFNVADLGIAIGVALLVAGALVEAWRSRERLLEPVDVTGRQE